jgi:hypothetical protein
MVPLVLAVFKVSLALSALKVLREIRATPGLPERLALWVLRA